MALFCLLHFMHSIYVYNLIVDTSTPHDVYVLPPLCRTHRLPAIIFISLKLKILRSVYRQLLVLILVRLCYCLLMLLWLWPLLLLLFLRNMDTHLARDYFYDYFIKIYDNIVCVFHSIFFFSLFFSIVIGKHAIFMLFSTLASICYWNIFFYF